MLRTEASPWLGLCAGPPGHHFWRGEDGPVVLTDFEGNPKAQVDLPASDFAWTGRELLLVERPGRRILAWDLETAPRPWAATKDAFGIDVGPVGRVVVSCESHLELYRQDGEPELRFGEDIPHRTFTRPGNRGVAWSGHGLIYVADRAFGLVKVFHEDGTLARFLGGRGFERLRHTVLGYLDEEPHARFHHPRGVAVDADGRLFVGEAGQDAVLVYSPVDRLLGRCTVRSPGGLYSDGAHLRVASTADSAIVTFAL